MTYFTHNILDLSKSAWCSPTIMQRARIHPIRFLHEGNNASITREFRGEWHYLFHPTGGEQVCKQHLSIETVTWSRASQNKQLFACWNRRTAVEHQAWQQRIRWDNNKHWIIRIRWLKVHTDWWILVSVVMIVGWEVGKNNINRCIHWDLREQCKLTEMMQWYGVLVTLSKHHSVPKDCCWPSEGTWQRLQLSVKRMTQNLQKLNQAFK